MPRSAPRPPARWLFAALAVALPLGASADAPARIPGFTESGSERERAYEGRLKAIPDPDVCRQHSRALSEHPALTGTSWDWQNVQYSLAALRSYGLEPELKTYGVYMPEWSTAAVRIELVAPAYYLAGNKEDGWPWQDHFDDVVIGMNSYSPSGDVTAELVYVNYGLPEDYAWLTDMGVDVRGKIAIARYGKVFRGVKNKVAADHGAAGLILYSDPADDGSVMGPVYPDGPWRPRDGIQRGTMLYVFEYPGDPLTPGWAAVEGAHRLDPAEAGNLAHAVPTAPLSYGEAEPLLRALDGPAVPAEWQGGLPFTYRAGPGAATVRLRVNIEHRVKPIWDVVVTIPGSEHPEQLVVLGAHRDGWTYGSNDSVSGFVVVMEIAHALARLQAEGWRPARTIVLGGWDGEETGILGSTEWAEEYHQQLARDAVAYIDLDSAGGGSYFTAAGVPSLDALIRDVTKEVEEPRTPGKSVFDDWVARSGRPAPPIDRLGGGYDYEAWIDHLGVPTIQLVFDYAGSGNYHSAYDDLYYLERWGDPGYLHHAAMARLAGIVALRLANADVLPFQYSTYAAEVSAYLDDLSARQRQRGSASAIDFSREISQANAWGAAARELEAGASSLLGLDATHAPAVAQRLASINERMIRQERDLTQAKGLPDRPWLKHMIYAPGLYTGYAVQTLSALEETLAAEDWPKVRNYRALLHDSLTRATQTARGGAVVPRAASATSERAPASPPP